MQLQSRTPRVVALLGFDNSWLPLPLLETEDFEGTEALLHKEVTEGWQEAKEEQK